MAETSQPHSHGPSFTSYLGGAWGASVVLIALIALLDPAQLPATLTKTATSL